tara:strand:+ start:7766 stop:8020 length:255 start_codon:yes stop_codon:yes gene_type:complete
MGLPHSGTSVVWDVLRHDPAFEAAIYEPLRESVLIPGGHTGLWQGPQEMLDAVKRYYSPAMEGHPITIPDVSAEFTGFYRREEQ